MVDPSLVGDGVNLEVRRVEWRNVRVPVPSWLRLSRTRPLPALPEGVELLGAWREQRMVALRFRLNRRSEAVSLDEARHAIKEGEPAFTLVP